MLAQLSFYQQAILTLAALILFSSFALLAQTRVVSMIQVFAWQGVLLAITTALVAMDSGLPHLYLSAALTLILKGLFIPWLLHRLIHKLDLAHERHPVQHPVSTLLLAALLVIFSYYVAQPIEQLSETITRNTIAISMAVILLGMLMLISRGKAVSQVVGFMSLENGLFFAAVSATHGMPMVVELGIAFDVLIAAVIFGVFFFHIRDSFDSLDVSQLHHLSESEQ